MYESDYGHLPIIVENGTYLDTLIDDNKKNSNSHFVPSKKVPAKPVLPPKPVSKIGNPVRRSNEPKPKPIGESDYGALPSEVDIHKIVANQEDDYGTLPSLNDLSDYNALPVKEAQRPPVSSDYGALPPPSANPQKSQTSQTMTSPPIKRTIAPLVRRVEPPKSADLDHSSEYGALPSLDEPIKNYGPIPKLPAKSTVDNTRKPAVKQTYGNLSSSSSDDYGSLPTSFSVQPEKDVYGGLPPPKPSPPAKASPPTKRPVGISFSKNQAKK